RKFFLNEKIGNFYSLILFFVFLFEGDWGLENIVENVGKSREKKCKIKWKKIDKNFYLRKIMRKSKKIKRMVKWKNKKNEKKK
ncbi:hypothetical protein RFI_39885, partial [Reticulomyxa filosa]